MVPFEDLCSNEKNSYSNKAVFSWENSKKNCSFTTRVVAAQNGNATELVIVNTNDQLVRMSLPFYTIKYMAEIPLSCDVSYEPIELCNN